MTTPKLLVTTLLPALIVGALGGGMLAASSTSDPPATADLPARQLAELSRGLRELTGEIAALRQALAGHGPPGLAREEARADGATTAPVAEPDGDRVAPALAQILARLSERPATGSIPVAGTTVATKQVERLNELRSQSEDDRSRAHFFWTYAQVVERYGTPDSMDASQDGGLIFLYRGPTPETQLGFTFHDGFVVRVWGN